MNENFKLNIESKQIECKPFSLKDYMNFLLAKSANDSELIKKWFYEILDKNTDLKTRTKHIVEYVIVNLLMKSLNENDVFQEFVCECQHEFFVKINPSKIMIDYGEESIENLYDFGAFKISLKYPNVFEDDDIIKMVVNSIESIYVGDDIIPISELSDYELNDLYNAIQPKDIEKIKNILLSPTLKLATPIVCPKCGKSHVHIISGFSEFIRILQ